MSKYQAFVFKNYVFDAGSKTLTCTYGCDDHLTFTETFKFDFDFVEYDAVALDRAAQQLFFMAGVSYYKAYLPAEIRIENGQVDAVLAQFLAKTYTSGLGEFFYVNQLDARTTIAFPTNVDTTLNMLSVSGAGQLIGLGGGKDSLVSVDILRNQTHVATWSLNHRSQLKPLAQRVGLPHLWVERTLDPQIGQLNNQGAMNGHVPISAIFACVGTVVAILAGFQDVVVSNESSANEPTLTYDGVAINHQYSKSLEFERDYQGLLNSNFGQSIRYYSLLRPFSELYIASMFAPLLDTYKDVFSSCNRAFVQASNHMSWCGECAKCAFVFLALTPFVDNAQLESLWGKNLLREPALQRTYQELLGIAGEKPLDCVGEIQESRTAMRLASQKYPELTGLYQFDIPTEYDFTAQSQHLIPADVFPLVQSYI